MTLEVGFQLVGACAGEATIHKMTSPNPVNSAGCKAAQHQRVVKTYSYLVDLHLSLLVRVLPCAVEVGQLLELLQFF